MASQPGHESLGEKNAKYFDSEALKNWPQWVVDLQQQIVDFLVSSEFPSWLGIEGEDSGRRRMMDYACGDGLISRSLKSYHGFVLGVDVSARMLDRFKEGASKMGLGEDEIMCVTGDFITGKGQPTDPPLPEDVLQQFDLVSISMALHHVEDPALAVKELVSRLKPGGKILVIDWTPLDGSTEAQKQYEEELLQQNKGQALKDRLASHAAAHTVGKPEGFTATEMGDIFSKAGCEGFTWKLADKLTYVEPIDAKGQIFWTFATKV